MAFVLPAPPRPALSVQGSDDLFPIRRIYCVGRNYAAHAREMGADEREPPFFFTKPGDAVVADGGSVAYPPATADLHHEVELVVAIGGQGAGVGVAEAAGLVWGYAVGVDLTRRDLQAQAKKAGKPWDMAKGFDQSAPIGPLVPAAGCAGLDSASIALSVDGETRQDGRLADMIWPVPEVIAHLSRLVILMPGDLIMTGTPDGVGPVARGETVRAEITGLPPLTFTMV